MSSSNIIECDLSKVDHILFGILSKEHIEKLSCVEVTEGTFYDSNGDPKLNSLFDPRMGTIERGRKCKTCEQDYIKCPGHPGHITLAKPVINLQFVDHIIKVVKCICPKCAKLLLNINHLTIINIVKSTKNKNKERFDKIFNIIKTLKLTRCGISPENDKSKGGILDNGGCGSQIPTKYVDKFRDFKDNPSGVLELIWKTSASNINEDGVAGTEAISQYLNSDMLLALFKRISSQDALVMGFSNEWCLPHWLIMESILVIPPACRPSVRQYNGQRSEDDITHKYTDIIKHNNTLKELLSKDEPVKQMYIDSEINQIQYHVATLQNNEDSQLPTANTRTGRPIKGLTERLNRKEGRIRSNLMGKRVDFSARSVISPDANIKMSELGVPIEIAMNLTFPEIVNKYNINNMYKLVRNGKNIYPGAKSIKYCKNGRIQLLIDSNLNEIELEYGDIINRHLQDGDYVLFNRQPTLHRMSMMGHRIKVMDGKTFRLNTDVCEPYNADFDGDEMNMHVPQSYQTLMELKYLTAVPHHFISPSTNNPIIKPSQDNLLGLFKITGESVLLSQIEAQHLLSGTESFNGILPEPSVRNGKYIRWSGKQIFSVVLPNISLRGKPKNDSLPEIIIENGQLLQGQIDKTNSGKIIQIIHADFGSVETERYMNDLQCIISRYLIKTGFSVGISDLIVHPDIVSRNKDIVKTSLGAEIDLSKKVHLDILENVTGNLSEIYEGKIAKINESLDKDIMNNTTKTLNINNNRIYFMVTSGAKGSDINIKQMMGLLGQQTIDGGRVPIGFTDRTLPHYPRYENGVESRGFISSNYLDGLNPMEFFFAAMAGREGLIDTAVKTANSGYLQRRFVKAMEDLKSYHDYSIRDNNNQIIEFMYGGDGFDSVKIEKQMTNFKLISGESLYKDYLFIENENMDSYMLKKTITTMNKKYPNNGWFKEMNEYNKKVQKCLDLIHTSLVKYALTIDDVEYYYPVNIKKLVKRTIELYKLDKITVKSSLNPVVVYHQLENIIDACRVNNRRNHILEILIYDYLSPKKVLRDYKMNQEALDYIFTQIKLGFQKALVSSGEMVGPIAAQSLGQESTQLTLNSVDWHTDIMYSNNNSIYVQSIGSLIDNLLDDENNKVKIKDIPENRTQYLDVSNLGIKIPSVYSSDNGDNNLEGLVSWKQITGITRHLPVGDLIKIRTKLNREVIATQQKSFLIWDSNTKHIIPTEGKDIKMGDCIPISINFCKEMNDIKDDKESLIAQGYTIFKDCVMDTIIDIQFVKPSKTYVYDFTVPDTLNFAIYNGIQMRDTFHLAGVGSSSKITQGVPRLNELIKVTKNPKNPSNYIYLQDIDRFNKERVEKIKNSIEQTKISEILKSDPAFYLEPTNNLDNVLEEDKDFMKFYEVFSELDKTIQQIPKNPWVIRMEFNRKEMIYRNISMADVHQSLKMIYPSAGMMYSDDNAGKLVFRMRIPFESKDIVNKDIKYLEGKAEELKDIIIKGVDNIEKVYISEPTKDCVIGKKKCKGFTKVGEFYEAKEEYFLSTDGANLFDLLIRDDIDSNRSYTSNPHEMSSIFGIEAGKFIIEQQIRNTMASNSALTSPRHIGLLVNKMCHSREYMSVDRHGINREDVGPLAKASFEQTSEQFKEAALFGAIDKLQGVSANIIVGQIPKSGTGGVKLYLDEELLSKELERRGTANMDTTKHIEEVNIDSLMNRQYTTFCISEDDKIKVNLNTIEKDGLSLSHIPEVILE